jgi:hypothetical protein
MARKENPPDVGGDDENQERRIDQGILENASLRRLVFGKHEQSLPGQSVLHLQK